MPIEDTAVGQLALDRALAMGLGTTLAFIEAVEDLYRF
jgi:ornithine cyclodeaminase/alanine dehydrogenase-like protein (mu-crystallin family)